MEYLSNKMKELKTNFRSDNSSVSNQERYSVEKD